MEKLLEKTKTKDGFNRFCTALADCVKRNEPISDNPMIDGMVIGFILTSNFALYFFMRLELGRMLDGTIQKFEQITIWCSRNEDKLCSIF